MLSPASPRRAPLRILATWALAALLPASSPRAQLVHRGVGSEGRVTQSIAFVDAWEDGGGGLGQDGTQDVLARRELVRSDGSSVRAVHLLLHGTWGHHLYSYDEVRVSRELLEATDVRTLARALDLDADGNKELVFIERSVTTKVALDDMGLPDDEPGPYFADAGVGIRYLARENGALVEHELEGDASTEPMKALLAAELGGAVNAWVQLAAADVDFVRERYEQARYRYGVVREWAESQLGAREISQLSPRLPLSDATADDVEVLWLAATRRIGALPRWYQRR